MRAFLISKQDYIYTGEGYSVQIMAADELFSFYLKTHYTVDGFQGPIRIDEHSAEADSFVAETGNKSWVYITAYNPFSKQIPEEQNMNLNQVLEKEISLYPYRKGMGMDPEGKWPGEVSFLVAGIAREKAIELAVKYRQNAVVYGEFGQPAELLIPD